MYRRIGAIIITKMHDYRGPTPQRPIILIAVIGFAVFVVWLLLSLYGAARFWPV
jgi:hypothetical protein